MGVAGNVEGCRAHTQSGQYTTPFSPSASELAFRPLADILLFFFFLFLLRLDSVFSFFIHSALFSPRVLTVLIRSPPSPFLRAMFLTALFPFPSPFCFFFLVFSLFLLLSCFVRSVIYFFRTPLSCSLVSSPLEFGLGAGTDIGSIRALPWATITCNTVGLSGPMGTRWGVLIVRKKDITVTHIESGNTPLRWGRARPIALVLSCLTCLMICQGRSSSIRRTYVLSVVSANDALI